MHISDEVKLGLWSRIDLYALKKSKAYSGANNKS